MRALFSRAQVAANNATIARQNEAYSAQATSVNTTQEGLKARAADAGVKEAAAANNLDVTSGSPAEVEVSQRELGALDVAQTASRGAQEVYGYGAQAANFEGQEKLESSQVAPDIAGGVLGATSSIIGGSPQVPGLYQWMQSSGGAGGSNPTTAVGDTDVPY